MRTMKQLLRQPTRSLFGVFLVSLAVAVLGVCLGQAVTARQTEADLEYRFTTIALPTQNYNFRLSQAGWQGTMHTMNAEVAAWVDQVIREHPELVETVSDSGLASAYIPELVGDHYQQRMLKGYYGVKAFGYSDSKANMLLPQTSESAYLSNLDTAMLVVRLESIGEVSLVKKNMTLNRIDPETGEKQKISVPQKYKLQLTGTIEQVISLAENLNDPTGRRIEIELTLPATQAVESLGLTVGQSYMVYGINYYDNSLRALEKIIFPELDGATDDMLASGTIIEIKPRDPALLHILTPEQKETFKELYPGRVVPAAIYGDLSVLEVQPGTQWDPSVAGVISEAFYKEDFYSTLSVYDYAAMPEFSYEDGSMLSVREVRNGEEVVEISLEEYLKRYSVPTIAPINGTVEEFLKENELWSRQLEYARINTHAFPVVGVDKLDYVADFARELARLVDGRDFTQTELKTGAKVCIISETLAKLNGLSVGDTITPQFYDPGQSVPYESYISLGRNIVLTNAYYYTQIAEMADTVEYTIIGLYRQDEEWADIFANNYTFTPNTIFVPKSSTSAPMDYARQGLFRSIVLKNGKVEEFDRIVLDKEFETILVNEKNKDMFVYYDQGYSQIKDSLHNYQKLAQQVLAVGLVVYGIILGLFLLLYPLRQGKTLRTMANFGAPRKDKIAYVVVSSLGILLPGTVLGAALGVTLWGVVVGRLLSISSALFSLTLDFGTLALISLAQLALAIVLVTLLAIPMTRHSNLMKRK